MTAPKNHASDFPLGSFDFPVQREALTIEYNRTEFQSWPNIDFIETGENERTFSPEEFEDVKPPEICRATHPANVRVKLEGGGEMNSQIAD